MFLFKIFIFSITLNESLETKYVERDVTDVFSDFGDDDTSTSHHVKNNVRKCTEGHTFYMDTKHKMPSCYKFSSIINMTGASRMFMCEKSSCNSRILTCNDSISDIEVWDYKNGKAYWNKTYTAKLTPYFPTDLQHVTQFQVNISQGDWAGLLLKVSMTCHKEGGKTVLLKIKGRRDYPLNENILNLPMKMSTAQPLSTTTVKPKPSLATTTTETIKTAKPATKTGSTAPKVKTSTSITSANTTNFSAERNVQSTSKTPIIIGTVLSVTLLVILVAVVCLIRRRASNQNQPSKKTHVSQVEQPMYAQYVSTPPQPSALEKNQQLEPRYETLVPENQSDYTYTYAHMHTNQNNQTTNTSEDDYYSVAASALPNETRPEELPEYAQLKK